MVTQSKHARKQRKDFFKAPLHIKRKRIASHLSEDLKKKYDRRSITLRTGDTVVVLRGGMKGHMGKVTEVDCRYMRIGIEGGTLTKADGKQVPIKFDASNLMITKLELSDKRRVSRLENKGGVKK